MRTTLDLDEKILKEAIKTTGITNKTKLINKALKDEIRAFKKQMLIDLCCSGIIDENYNVEKIRELELDEW